MVPYIATDDIIPNEPDHYTKYYCTCFSVNHTFVIVSNCNIKFHDIHYTVRVFVYIMVMLQRRTYAHTVLLFIFPYMNIGLNIYTQLYKAIYYTSWFSTHMSSLWRVLVVVAMAGLVIFLYLCMYKNNLFIGLFYDVNALRRPYSHVCVCVCVT